MELCRPYILTCRIQPYDWGTQNELERLFGIANPNGEPQAELWMGAHPAAPSTLTGPDGAVWPLDAFIEQAPELLLGPEVHARFSGKLPFLFKVLSAGTPLSVQAHPGLEQATLGFARENTAAIPPQASHRSYKDANHKPELICALTPFKAMKGFRFQAEIMTLLRPIPHAGLQAHLALLQAPDDPLRLKQFYAWLMRLRSDEKAALLQASVCYAAAHAHVDAYATLLELQARYPGDVGCLSPLLLNVITLQPGEALFLPAGELHAYLLGTGVELMANSDNVLRGGLTPKHVDVEELLKILTFATGNPDILRPQGTLEKTYPTLASEFVLSVLDLTDGIPCTFVVKGPQILFCAHGNLWVKTDRAELPFTRGQAIFLPACLQSCTIGGSGRVYKATVA